MFVDSVVVVAGRNGLFCTGLEYIESKKFGGRREWHEKVFCLEDRQHEGGAWERLGDRFAGP